MTDHLRPTVASIDLEQLRKNLEVVRGLLPGGTKILAAVKGDAYGHGAIHCARTLADAGVDWFGVALVEEGRALRRAGIKTPILCLGGAGPNGSNEALRHDLTPLIGDVSEARIFDEAARKAGRVARVHIKVDTGMGRLGVPIHLWTHFLDRMAELENLSVAGIASHLAESESTDGVLATKEQLRKFDESIEAARFRGFNPDLIHLANSGAIARHRGAMYSMVRPGLLLYGYDPSDRESNVGVSPIMRVRTRILVVRDLPVGVGVSYGAMHRTQRPSRIATLPVGYADGYPRALSGRAEVLVHGCRAPVLGRVCMDMCMIDVTDVPHHVKSGDEVVLLGQQGNEIISAWDLADAAGTIPYEVLTGFSERMPRVC